MTSGRSAETILALTRELRHAVARRQEITEAALHAYNQGRADRLDYAAEFLTTMQRADVAYEESSKAALQAYREHMRARVSGNPIRRG